MENQSGLLFDPLKGSPASSSSSVGSSDSSKSRPCSSNSRSGSLDKVPIIPFPLASLPSNLLGRVVTKVDCTSFFRLQQTCKDINELVRKNRSISVDVGKHLPPLWSWKKYNDGVVRLDPVKYCFSENGYAISSYGACIDIESLYGVRFEKLPLLPIIQEGDYKLFYDTLKKYRITTNILSFMEDDLPKEFGETPYTNDQCEALLKILKPTVLKLDCLGEHHNQWEVSVPSKQLKKAEVTVEPANALKVIKKFIPYIICLRISTTDQWTSQDFFHLLRGLMPTLHYESLPNLCCFRFNAGWEGIVTSTEDILGILAEFNPTVLRESRRTQDSSVEELELELHLGPDRKAFQLQIDDYNVTIYFCRTDYDDYYF